MRRHLNTSMPTIVIALAIMLSNDSLLAQKAEANTAAESPVIEELFLSPSVFPEDKGELQITVAPIWTGTQESGNIRGAWQLEYGITNSFQVELEGNSRLAKRGTAAESPNSLGLGIQYSWMRIKGGNTHFTAGLELEGWDNSIRGYEPYVVIAHDAPQLHNIHLFVTAGAELERESGTLESETVANTGFVLPIGLFRFTNELNIRKPEEDDAVIAYTPGVVWKPLEAFEIGVGVPLAISREKLPEQFILQITLEF